MSNYDSALIDNSAKAISRLIAFFDLFEYPLTSLEIWHYLDKKIALREIIMALDELIVGTAENQVGPSFITQKNGFYFLAGREEILFTRQKRHNYSQRKLKIARRFGRLFSILPYVKTVTVANSLGGYNLRDGSDIDFFIITAARRVWLSRLFCTGLAKVLNRRPTTKNKKDKICLSFYLADDRLKVADLGLSGFDPYFYYWQRSLILLYNKDVQYQEFLAANKLSNIPSVRSVRSVRQPNKSTRLGDYFEKKAQNWQLKIMPADLLNKNNQGEGVVINDSVIKLYLLDRRLEFLKKYEEKIKSLD